VTPSSSPRGERRAAGTLGAVVLFGVPLRFHFTFLLLAVVLAIAGLAGSDSAWLEIVYIAAIFTSVVFHELGHVLVARGYGIRTIEIVLYPIGGVARLVRSPRPGDELWIALAGPAVNVAIWLVSAVVLWAAADGRQPSWLDATGAWMIRRVARTNLFLAAFNMLPAFPMDGGRVLRSLLAFWKGEDEATRLAVRIGRGLALCLGIYGLVTGKLILLFVAFFVYSGATQEGLTAQSHSLSVGWPVRAAMVTEYRTLNHGNTVREAGDLLLATSQQDFPVLHGEQVVGLLDRGSLLKAMADIGPESYVATVMRRDYLALSPETDLAEALPMLGEAGVSALVIEGERLVGMLTRDNLTEFLVMRRIGVNPSSRTA